MVEKLTKKVHHGPHARETRGQGVDRKATHTWVREGKMTPTTEALVMAAQDDVVMTRDYMFKLPGGSSGDRMCRLCGAYKESLGHLLSKCKVYEHKEYRRRHDAVLYLLVKQVADHLGVKVPNCLKVPGGGIRSGVMGKRGKRMLIDVCIRVITERKPDLVVRLDDERRITIYEVACAWDRTVGEREQEKRAKYMDLAADLAKQWKGYTVVTVPVVLGDLGVIRNFMKQAKMLTDKEIARFAAEAQREVLCWMVKLLKRTLSQ